MKNLHRALLKKYRWYDVWHKNPKHSIYHWLALPLFIILPVILMATQIVTFKVLQEKEATASERIQKIPPSILHGATAGAAGDRILVAFRSGVGQNERALVMKKHRLTEKSSIGYIDVQILTVAPGQKPEDAVAELQKQEGAAIEYAEVDTRFTPDFIPNDPNYPSEWHQATVNSPAAWDKTHGENVTVAIADTGVDATHPDLASHLVPGWNFYDNNADTSDVYGHGTAVAGTAAAIGDNGLQVVGVAYNASIMPLRISDTQGYAYASTIANAISYAANRGVKIVNISYAIGGSATISRAARYLGRAGGIVIASEGNSGGPSGSSNDNNIINVSATDNSDTVTSWSTYGNDVDVSAPGLAILTTARGGGTVSYSGTSFSAPLTSGVIALMWSANPSLGPGDITKALFASAVDLGPAGWDDHYGWGRVDAGRAVTAALEAAPAASPNLKGGGKPTK